MFRTKESYINARLKPSRILAGMAFLFFAAELITAIWISQLWQWTIPLNMLWMLLSGLYLWRFWQKQKRYSDLRIQIFDQIKTITNTKNISEEKTITQLPSIQKIKEKNVTVSLWSETNNKNKISANQKIESMIQGAGIAHYANIGTWIIFLYLRTFSGKAESITLAYDSCNAEDWRTLQVWLHQTKY